MIAKNYESTISVATGRVPNLEPSISFISDSWRRSLRLRHRCRLPKSYKCLIWLSWLSWLIQLLHIQLIQLPRHRVHVQVHVRWSLWAKCRTRTWSDDAMIQQMDKIQTLDNFTPHLVFLFQGLRRVDKRNQTLPTWHVTHRLFNLDISERGCHTNRFLRVWIFCPSKVCDIHETRKLLTHLPPQHGWPWKSGSTRQALGLGEWFDLQELLMKFLFGLA